VNDRERFNAVMHYGEFDRGIIQDFSYWDQTVDVWHLYGLPEWVDRSNAETFFGLDPFWNGVGGAAPTLCPAFTVETLEEDSRSVTYRASNGTIERKLKYSATIPEHLGYTLKDRDSWERHYKWRLDPDHPDRLADDLDERFAGQTDDVRTWPLRVSAGSMFGELREWMGLEGVTYIQLDDPPLFAEMIRTIGDCIVQTLERHLGRARRLGVTFDYASMWEDMCCAQGPLLSLKPFRELLVPHYRRISQTLRRFGCDLIMLDSDGDVRPLLADWVKSGVNITFPLEVGRWGQDPVAVRKEYGKELRIAGGFDKHILVRGQDAIAAEIDRLSPLVEEGGFVPFCDHRVPPNVPLENYHFYVRRAKKVWGRGLSNLRETGELDASAPLYGKPYDYASALERFSVSSGEGG